MIYLVEKGGGYAEWKYRAYIQGRYKGSIYAVDITRIIYRVDIKG